MSYPILLSLSNCFDQTFVFVNPYKYLIGIYFLPPASVFQSSPQPCLQCFYSVDFHLVTTFHVLHTYHTTGHTNTFIIIFFNILLNPFVKSSFLLLNASFAITVLLLHPYGFFHLSQ